MNARRLPLASSIALLLLFAASTAQAESGLFNLHLDLGAGVPAAGDLGPNTDADRRIAIGVLGDFAVDWQLATPFALELMVGGGYFFRGFPDTDDSGTPNFRAALGGRVRFLDNREGYADEETGDYDGNFWVSAHVGFHLFDGPQLGFDGGLGYEWSVVRPLQIGVFGRAQILLGGDRDKLDVILYGGVSFSIELGEADALDTDGDGLSDEREVNRYQTDPTNPDTDGDQLGDGLEVDTNTNPINPDTDADGAADGVEDANKNGSVDSGETDPRDPDTDHGGVPDGYELAHPPMNPIAPEDDDSDHDGVPEHLDRCPGTPPNTEVGPDGCAILRAQMVLAGIQFEFDSAAILSSSEPTLLTAAQILKDNPDERVEIGGHTDNVGTEAYNRRLSQQRAESVRQWLVEHGIEAARMRTRGYGSSQPIAPNDTEPNRALNRRIEFRRIESD